MPIKPRENRQIIAATQTLTGAVLGLGLFGYALDKNFDTAPYLLLLGLLLGVALGLYDLWKTMFPKNGEA